MCPDNMELVEGEPVWQKALLKDDGTVAVPPGATVYRQGKATPDGGVAVFDASGGGKVYNCIVAELQGLEVHYGSFRAVRDVKR